MRCILLSEKSWHDALFLNLQSKTDCDWVRIDSKDQFTKSALDALQPGWIFIPHWSYIIPAKIYENYNCVVFHMTDLPFGRGGSPLQNLIVRGYAETKISAIKVTEGIDTGDVYLKRPLSLSGTAEEIFKRSSTVIEEMIIEILENEIIPIPQAGEPVIFKRRNPAESDLSQLEDITSVYDYIRMLDAEGYPNAYLETEHFRYEFSGATLSSDQSITANVRIIKK